MPASRALASVLIVLLLTLLAIANLPPSQVRDDVLDVTEPVMTALGIRQVWDVFAPDPRAVSLGTEVRFRYADGTTGAWSPPDDGFGRLLSGDRWVKIGERAPEDAVGPPLLGWAIREQSDPARPLEGAALVRIARDVAPPGLPKREAPPARTTSLFEAAR